MKTLIATIYVPVLALAAALPAQDATEAKASKAAEKATKMQDQVTDKDAAVTAIDKFTKKQSIDKDKANWRTRLPEPPKQEFSSDHEYFWHMETECGALKIRFYPDTAPMHVTTGIYLSRLGYYDGLNFHRIIPGFMAQGGCPTGTGTGGPGFFMEGEFKGNRKHDKAGVLSTANTGRPRSEGSQFFITFGPTRSLDGKYTIWGQVVEGMETVQALAKRGTRSNNGMLMAKGPKIKRTWISVMPKEGAEGDHTEGGEKGEHAEKGGHDEKGKKGEHGKKGK